MNKKEDHDHIQRTFGKLLETETTLATGKSKMTNHQTN